MITCYVCDAAPAVASLLGHPVCQRCRDEINERGHGGASFGRAIATVRVRHQHEPKTTPAAALVAEGYRYFSERHPAEVDAESYRYLDGNARYQVEPPGALDSTRFIFVTDPATAWPRRGREWFARLGFRFSRFEHRWLLTDVRDLFARCVPGATECLSVAEAVARESLAGVHIDSATATATVPLLGLPLTVLCREESTPDEVAPRRAELVEFRRDDYALDGWNVEAFRAAGGRLLV